MSAPNILLTRIDNRLVHGQVGVTWTSTLGANLLIVVDDDVAKDEIQQKLMGITADTYGFGIRFFSIEKTAAIISKAAPHQKIFLICRTPEIVRKLIEAGVPLKDVNVGNMHYANGKQQIAKTVSVDANDITAFNGLKTAGVECFVQGVPTEAALDLFKLL